MKLAVLARKENSEGGRKMEENKSITVKQVDTIVNLCRANGVSIEEFKDNWSPLIITDTTREASALIRHLIREYKGIKRRLNKEAEKTAAENINLIWELGRDHESGEANFPDIELYREEDNKRIAEMSADEFEDYLRSEQEFTDEDL